MSAHPNNAAELKTPRPNTQWIPALIVYGFIALGIALQLAQYFANRNLRLDEAAFALNLIEKSHLELLGPMDYSQNSPLLFLLILKTFLVFAGYSEYALRAIPLFSAILSMPLLYLLARCVAISPTPDNPPRTLKNMIAAPGWDSAIIALAFYAICKHTIFFSSDLRQYSTNILVVCILYLYVMRPSVTFMPEQPSGKFFAGLIILGALSVWISLAAIFVVGGIGAAYLLFALINRNAPMTKWSVLMCAVWIVSFALQYAVMDSNIDARGLRAEMVYFQSAGTAPLPPTSFADLKWYREAFEKMMYFPVGLTYRGLGMFAVVAGCIAIGKRNPPFLLMLLLPIALVLIASSLGKYPFKDRYILFLIPALLILIGEGIGLFFVERNKTTRIIAVAFFAMLYVQPFAHGVRHFARPHYVSEVTPLLSHMRENWEDGSIAFFTWSTAIQLKYYQHRYGFSDDMVFLEPRDPHMEHRVWEYRTETIPNLHTKGDPYWALFEHDTGPPIPTHIGEVDAFGLQLEVVQGDGATLYRYTRPDADLR